MSVLTSGTLMSRLPSPIEVDARIRLLIDLKNLDENLIAIDIDINNLHKYPLKKRVLLIHQNA